LTLYSQHHPAGFAIGHRHHGKPRRTAWQMKDHPFSDVSQRIPNRSNVPFESRFSNDMKMDYDELHHDQMREELRDLCKPETTWWSRLKDDMPSLQFEYAPGRAMETARQILPRTTSERNIRRCTAQCRERRSPSQRWA
jgi:hypothetical protein